MIKIQEVINNLQNKIDRYDKLVELINFIENKSSYTYDVKDIKIIENVLPFEEILDEPEEIVSEEIDSEVQDFNIEPYGDGQITLSLE